MLTLVTYEGEISVYSRVNPNPYVAIVGDLGIALAPAADSDELYAYYSYELLTDPTLRADVVLHLDDGSEDPTTLALWPQLPAVVAGQAHEVPVPALTSYRTGIRVLDTLLPLLQSADPATV